MIINKFLAISTDKQLLRIEQIGKKQPEVIQYVNLEKLDLDFFIKQEFQFYNREDKEEKMKELKEKIKNAFNKSNKIIWFEKKKKNNCKLITLSEEFLTIKEWTNKYNN